MNSATCSRTYARASCTELDFKREAGNLRRLGDSLRDFEQIVIPEPIEDFTTSRVLTMDYIAGKKITSVGPLRLLELGWPVVSRRTFSRLI